MPSRIQRVPLGLLDLLGLQSSGQAPTLLPDVLQGVLDIGYLYLWNRREFIRATTNAVSANGFWGAGATAPAVGEMWVVLSGFLAPTTPLPALTNYQYRPAIGNLTGGDVFWTTDNPIECNPGEDCAHAFSGMPIIMNGQAAGLWADWINIGTATQFDVNLQIARLKV